MFYQEPSASNSSFCPSSLSRVARKYVIRGVPGLSGKVVIKVESANHSLCFAEFKLPLFEICAEGSDVLYEASRNVRKATTLHGQMIDVCRWQKCISCWMCGVTYILSCRW